MTGSGARSQVNIRLAPQDAEILAALAFLANASAAEVLRPVVQDFLQQQRNDPQVKAALEIRAQSKSTYAQEEA